MNTGYRFRRIFCLCAVLAGLTACTKPDAQPEENYRTVNRTDIELRPLNPDALDNLFRRDFEQRDIDGWIGETGNWSVETVVNHGRFRCGIYEVGIQLGRGAPACTDVQWFSDTQFRTRERQCNNASIIHSGTGTLPVSREQVIEATCVRINTRCAGTC